MWFIGHKIVNHSLNWGREKLSSLKAVVLPVIFIISVFLETYYSRGTKNMFIYPHNSDYFAASKAVLECRDS